MRTIKRYSNRKLYDPTVKHYVGLADVLRFIRDGEDLAVVDHRQGSDLTSQTIAQALAYEEKTKPTTPVAALVKVVRGQVAA